MSESGFDFKNESFEGKYAKVATDAYTVSEPHHPAGAKGMGEINNRAFIYAVETKENGKHLLMSGIPGPGCIPKVQQIEKDTKLALLVIVGSGDFHHMATKNWLDAYPKIRIYHSNVKFPNTRNGSTILANAEYKARLTLMDGPDFPMLAQYSKTLRFFGFNQFFTYSDQEWMSKDANSSTKLGTMGFMKKFSGVKADQKYLSVWTYHVPTRTLVAEHNFRVYYSKEHMKTQPMVIKMSQTTENFGSEAANSMPRGPYTLEDCKTHCEQMAPLIELDVACICDYHAWPGTIIKRLPSKEAFKQFFKKSLSATGEDDITGAKMHAIINKKKGCTIS